MAETTFTSSSVYAGAQTTASWIASKLPKELANPQVGIICGSGLGGLAQTVSKEPILEFTYGDIPGFVSSAGE